MKAPIIVVVLCLLAVLPMCLQQQLDINTCRLLCTNCDKSRQVFAKMCLTRTPTPSDAGTINGTSSVDSGFDCPCLRDTQTRQNELPGGSSPAPESPEPLDCPERQPPPPPPDCPTGSFVRCRLGGPNGRCYGNCTCLATEDGPDEDEQPTLQLGLSFNSSCRLPRWLSKICQRNCRRRHGGDGRLQVDGRGCERCRCCLRRGGPASEPCFGDSDSY
ncbi:hypothetical protein BOX15_Mlig012835g1 [Macrostomum lignano]|uniref:Uncharacterized protein n=1 Tax=Macrostomum lignano TaxID=282301 RepID=A0A267EWI1_9PLAT|nr:hypothetical protein BOX15_Mlig012835g1 [Macrostomum lignano]